MEICTVDEARKNVEEFSLRLLALEEEKQKIADDISELKSEFKECGTPVAIVTRIINAIKKSKKKSQADKFEEDTISEWLENHTEINEKIEALVAK